MSESRNAVIKLSEVGTIIAPLAMLLLIAAGCYCFTLDGTGWMIVGFGLIVAGPLVCILSLILIRAARVLLEIEHNTRRFVDGD